MARNSLAPGFVRIFYSTVVSSIPMQHRMTLPVIPAPGALGGWEVAQRNLSLANWNSAVDAFITVIKPLLHSSTTFQYAELWTQADENSEPVYRENYDISVPGTNATVSVSAEQLVMTFRTTNNGRAKLTLLECPQPANQRFQYSGMAAAQKAVADYLMGNTSWIVGRDGGWPNTFAYMTTKINDALRKHRMNL